MTNYYNSPEDFNNYFLTVTENIIKNIRFYKQKHNTYNSPIIYRINLVIFPNISFKNTSTKETENIIKSLKAKEFYGYDGIIIKILKIRAPFICSPLSYIFNRSMLSGIFPTRLKYATIKPNLKNGDKKNVANYRPISILPSLSKIFEKIIYVRLNHLETNNILAAEQFGFRTSSSMEQGSFNFINNIQNEFKKKVLSEVFSLIYKRPSIV
jgi:potassium voltage-gated channel Eag-related subfamily H protein 8